MSATRPTSRAALAAGAVLALLHPAPASALQSPLGYSVTLPQGWKTTHQVRAGADGVSTDMTFASPAQKCPLLRIEVDPQEGATMARAKSGLEDFVRVRLPGFKVAAERQCRVGGEPAAELAAGGYIQGQPMLVDVVFTIHGGRDYTITLMTKADRVGPDVETFGRILDTFRWTRPAR